MVIRSCKYSDFAEFYPSQYFYCTYDEIKTKMDNGHFYVVKDNGKIIGCGGIATYWDSLTESWIHTIFEFLENDEYAKRANRIEIHAAMSAIPFYRKLGYEHKNGQLIYAEGHFDMEKFI